MFIKEENTIDIKQLRYFLTIANEGQITKAAKKLHMAQPPLSYQLKLLEQEIDMPLFERNKKQMELTPAGKLLYKKALELIDKFDETMVEVKELKEGLRGTLIIGFVKSCFSYLPERIRHFQYNYPDVNFQLRDGDPYFIGELLRNREIDVGIVRTPLDMQGFSSIELPKESFVAVIPKEWRKDTFDKTIMVKDLENLPLLILQRISGAGFYEMINEECEKHGFLPNIICQCPDSNILLNLAASGIGVTIIPESMILPFHRHNLNTYRIEDFSLVSEAAVIWSKEQYLSKVIAHFIDTFRIENIILQHK
ncbi:LysR family transcriptional regulator [Bacillus sp. FJAT-45350]|uniref:LysR family transcriptional regulator n=1 Tax=Bacillus sp. FJAT-45350 TaxID=2011014 RepID=UPI00211BE51F|nr:LysR family transcriptional regulator [Bacillus sp. FJAT-45350]